MFLDLQNECKKKMDEFNAIKNERVKIKNDFLNDVSTLEVKRNNLKEQKNNFEKEMNFNESNKLCSEIKEVEDEISVCKEKLSLVEKELEFGWDELKTSAMDICKYEQSIVLSVHDELRKLIDANKEIQSAADLKKGENDILYRDIKVSMEELSAFSQRVKNNRWGELWCIQPFHGEE